MGADGLRCHHSGEAVLEGGNCNINAIDAVVHH